MDDKFKADFRVLFKQQFEENFIKWFNRGFDEVISPALNDISNDVKTLQTEAESLKVGQNRIENKLDLVSDQVIDHDSRIKKMETPKTVVAHTIRK